MKTYKLTRKLNLGKFGHQYEALDYGVEGCESFAEAKKEMGEMKAQIMEAFAPDAKKRIAVLNSKQALNVTEQQERQELLNMDSPF